MQALNEYAYGSSQVDSIALEREYDGEIARGKQRE